MKTIIFFLFSLSISFLSFSQEKETNVVVQLSNNSAFPIFSNGSDSYNLTKIAIGLDFQKERRNLYLYLNYGFCTNLPMLSDIKDEDNDAFLYKGHYLGISFEYHFLNNKKKIRPYFGLSSLSEIATNYKEGFLESKLFVIRHGHIHYEIYNYGGTETEFNSSVFYYSTPFLGTISLGCDFRLMEGLHLNLSAGYKFKVLRYKYLEWYNDDDYRSMLKSAPIQSKIFHFIDVQLGLSYTFSFHKEKQPE